MDGWTGRHPRVHYLGTGNRPVVASYFHSPSLLETKPEERLGVGHAALRAAGVLHALSRTAEPAPGVGARAQQGLGLRDGHGGRATERHRDLGRAGLRLPRLRTALCLHSPRRTRPGTRPGDRLVRLGVSTSTTTSSNSTSVLAIWSAPRSTWTGCERSCRPTA